MPCGPFWNRNLVAERSGADSDRVKGILTGVKSISLPSLRHRRGGGNRQGSHSDGASRSMKAAFMEWPTLSPALDMIVVIEEERSRFMLFRSLELITAKIFRSIVEVGAQGAVVVRQTMQRKVLT